MPYLPQGYTDMISRPRAKGSAVPCAAHHITWHPQGYQCLNCGAYAEHSWDIKHIKK